MNGGSTRATPAQPLGERRVWLLLTVAFGDRPRAQAAWHELAPVLDIDAIAHDAHGVFGQLAASLRELDLDTDVLPRLDGVRKRLWTKNSVRVRDVMRARGLLAREGIGAEPTGGLAVLLRQRDLGQRPLVDAELVVSKDSAQTAVSVLTGGGWTEVGHRRDGWLLDLHAVTLRKAGSELTLRWCERDWPYHGPGQGREPHTIVDGCEVTLPSAAELLAYTLVEGFRLWGYTPTRRRADILLLLQDPHGVSWRELREIVRGRSGSLAAAAALEEVRTITDLVPAALPATLAGEAHRPRDRWALAAGHRHATAAVLLRRTSGMPVARAIAASPKLLREVWDLPQDTSLSVAGARRLRARLSAHAI